MKINNRKSVSDNLKKYDYLAKDNDFIEVTEWTNGEGIDVQISEKPTISITYGELEALNYLKSTLMYNDIQNLHSIKLVQPLL